MNKEHENIVFFSFLREKYVRNFKITNNNNNFTHDRVVG